MTTLPAGPTCSVRAAADILGVSRSLLYRLIAAEEVPAVRLGSAVRVPTWWLRQRVEEPRAEPQRLQRTR